jgi:hypothetical protein
MLILCIFLSGNVKFNPMGEGKSLYPIHPSDPGIMPTSLTHFLQKGLELSPQEFPKDQYDQGLGTLC